MCSAGRRDPVAGACWRGGFPRHYYRGSELLPDAAAAVKVCRECPSQIQCLTYALETRQGEGIWGGTTPQERGRKVRKRFRGMTTGEIDPRIGTWAETVPPAPHSKEARTLEIDAEVALLKTRAGEWRLVDIRPGRSGGPSSSFRAWL